MLPFWSISMALCINCTQFSNVLLCVVVVPFVWKAANNESTVGDGTSPMDEQAIGTPTHATPICRGQVAQASYQQVLVM